MYFGECPFKSPLNTLKDDSPILVTFSSLNFLNCLSVFQTGVSTQGFECARQALYHLIYTSHLQPFFNCLMQKTEPSNNFSTPIPCLRSGGDGFSIGFVWICRISENHLRPSKNLPTNFQLVT
jgi:hypothetical protein